MQIFRESNLNFCYIQILTFKRAGKMRKFKLKNENTWIIINAGTRVQI